MFRSAKRRTAGRRNFESTPIHNNNNNNNNNTNNINTYINQCYNDSKLTFYNDPPLGEITIDQFESYAIDRIKILNEIESALIRNKSLKEIEEIISPMLSTLLPLNSSNFEKLTIFREKDYYSHFILRLCFAKSKELREKFIKNESILFKIRFNQLSKKDQFIFIKSLNLPWEIISLNEKNLHSINLFKSISSSLQFQLNLFDESSKRKFFENESFIKIPFENCIELISNRSIFLNKGFAYIPQFQQLNLLINEFINHLKIQLLNTSHAFPSLDEDDRILPILSHLSTNSNVSSYNPDFNNNNNNNNGDINSNSIYSNEIKQNFPLCGIQLFKGLTLNNHLKYLARQQFTLFLKGIGLSLDDALKFWNNEFTKKISNEKFEKEYSYNIRHSYGKEGARINYKPWDCKTILSKPKPSKNEFHGCPYRDLNNDLLKLNLLELGLNEKDSLDILEIRSKGEFTNACTKVLELKSGINELVIHPNLYFDRMRQNQLKRNESIN